MNIGDKVDKSSGYKFPGTIVCVFKTLAGELRYVVELEGYGLLHIFSEKNLIKKDPAD